MLNPWIFLLIGYLMIIQVKTIYKVIKCYKENPMSFKYNIIIWLIITLISLLLIYIYLR